MRIRIASAISMALLSFGLTVVAAPSASAAPWNCPISGQANSRSTICLQGTGYYRVGIHCINWATAGSTSTFRYGPWLHTSSGRPSAGWCQWYEYVGAAWASTK